MLALRRARLLIFGAVAVAALAVATVFVPAAAGGKNPLIRLIHPRIVVASPIVYQGTFGSGVATLEADNTGSGYGLIGTANSAPGVFGTSNSGVGLVGLSTDKYGISGSSVNNFGLNGFSQNATGVGGSGPNGIYPNAGVFGTTSAGNNNAIGVYGTVGSLGFGSFGECANALAANTHCVGVYGQALGAGGHGVVAFASSSTTTADAALEADSNGAPLLNMFSVSGGNKVVSIDGSGNTSIAATLSIAPAIGQTAVNISDPSGIGLESNDAGTANTDEAVRADSNGFAVVGSHHGASAIAAGFFSTDGAEASGTSVLTAYNYGTGTFLMTLDNSGNMQLSGQLFTSGVCSSGCIAVKNSSGRRLTAYAPADTMRTVEDFGSGQIVNGQGYVKLDPAFAGTLDPRAAYLVFLTPDGDNNGLYIAQKTPSGFVVRESRGGHSTLAFDYRIVGKPIGVPASRLPPIAPNAGMAAALPARSAPDARAVVRAAMRTGRAAVTPGQFKPHKPRVIAPY